MGRAQVLLEDRHRNSEHIQPERLHRRLLPEPTESTRRALGRRLGGAFRAAAKRLHTSGANPRHRAQGQQSGGARRTQAPHRHCH